MTTIIEHTHKSAAVEHKSLILFQVWIDLTFGTETPDWWWNSPPKLLSQALDECTECRQGGWGAKIMPEGVNPRPDGRWDNP